MIRGCSTPPRGSGDRGRRRGGGIRHDRSARLWHRAAVGGTDKIVLFGGYDGNKWLSDAHVLDTANGVWRLPFPSPSPSRSGHAMSTAQNGRHSLGGQGPNGTLCHDLWALRGVDENIRDDDHDDTSPSRTHPRTRRRCRRQGGAPGDAAAAGRRARREGGVTRSCLIVSSSSSAAAAARWMSKQQEYCNDSRHRPGVDAVASLAGARRARRGRAEPDAARSPRVSRDV